MESIQPFAKATGRKLAFQPFLQKTVFDKMIEGPSGNMRPFQEDYYPQAGWIIDAIHERVVPLPGHVVKQNYTNGELQRIGRLGV